jgi:hypothetical protein
MLTPAPAGAPEERISVLEKIPCDADGLPGGCSSAESRQVGGKPVSIHAEGEPATGRARLAWQYRQVTVTGRPARVTTRQRRGRLP